MVHGKTLLGRQLLVASISNNEVSQMSIYLNCASRLSENSARQRLLLVQWALCYCSQLSCILWSPCELQSDHRSRGCPQLMHAQGRCQTSERCNDCSTGAVAGSVLVLLHFYAWNAEVPSLWPGIAGIFQVILILGSALIFWVSRTGGGSDDYGGYSGF